MNVDSELLHKIFKCYKSPYNKHRLGTQNRDGGYIVAIDNLLVYDAFLSGGIGNNIDFENDFLSKFPELVSHTYVFDGSIQSLPKNNKNVTTDQLISKNIGINNNENTQDIKQIIDRYNNLFIKLDIESGEWPIFESLTTEQMNKISQMVIEFHHLNHILNSKSKFPVVSVLEKIANTHYIIHAHGNNCCGTTKVHDIDIPCVLELTLLRKNHINNPEPNSDKFPSDIDMPNLGNKIEINLNYPPFVHRI